MMLDPEIGDPRGAGDACGAFLRDEIQMRFKIDKLQVLSEDLD